MLPQIDRRGGCKRQESQCGAVLGCARYRAEAATQAKQNLRCCTRRRKSKWLRTGHGVTNGALRYEAAETVRKEAQAVVMCMVGANIRWT